MWQENFEALELFLALSTQWRIVAGFAGASYTGLIYSEAIGLMRERGLNRNRRAELLDDLRVMERAALPALNGRDDDG